VTPFVGRFGPERLADGRINFRLWAPAAQCVELMLEGEAHAMTAMSGGWYELAEPQAESWTRYRFRIDGELVVPDPASHYQPNDVSGPSVVVDHAAYRWHGSTWRGRPWHEAAIYELHIGAFSPQGTFRGAIENLDHLVASGFTAVELMPVADFPGARNWGYDGVLLFAPDSTYGTPDDLKALIDAAHQRGLMVFLDVVYNHFGPEGNYLPVYAPDFFTKDVPTPWGAAIDYARDEVRAFVVQNALHWLRDYRFDGLRLDAVHAIRTRGAPSILDLIADVVGALAEAQDRQIHLILENDDNCADLLDPNAMHRGYRAQWNDDYHHAWHVLMTGESTGYYEDYQKPFAMLRRALMEGFVYQGEISKHRGGARRGQKSRAIPPLGFVNFLQNHDQIGNRPYGDRLEVLAPRTAIESALAITLLAPFTPMLFMGEEWGCRQPFPFFCDFTGDLARAVEEGRRREFAQAYQQAKDGGEPPSALDPQTFLAAKLDWSGWDQDALERYELVRLLLVMRQREIVPRLQGARPVRTDSLGAAKPIALLTWTLADGAGLTLLANLSAQSVPCELAFPNIEPLWGRAPDSTLPPTKLAPWQAVWWLEAT